MKEYTKNLGKVVMTPKGAWSIEKEYEILDIVHDSVTDHAYISKQEVPSGVDLSDSRYWMPLNVSGYSDSNVITLNSFNEDGEIQSYTLEKAIKTIKDVGRKSGAILIFYNDNVNRLDITTGCWEIWQFNSINVYDWENLDVWVNIYYNYNKFIGWYAADNTLNKEISNPDVGCYAFVGNIYNEAVVYRCDVKNKWTKTNQKAQHYIKVVFGNNVTIGANGNWWQDGIDTNIPVSVKGDNGLTPYLRWSVNNQIEYSYDNINWYILSNRFNTNIKIKDYVRSVNELSNNVELGTIYGVGPVYAEDDIEQTNPIYNIYVYTSNGWINNGEFNSISAGVVQEVGDSEKEVMSQKAVTDKFIEINSILGDISSYKTKFIGNGSKNRLSIPILKGNIIYEIPKTIEAVMLYGESDESFRLTSNILPFIAPFNILYAATVLDDAYLLVHGKVYNNEIAIQDLYNITTNNNNNISNIQGFITSIPTTGSISPLTTPISKDSIIYDFSNEWDYVNLYSSVPGTATKITREMLPYKVTSNITHANQYSSPSSTLFIYVYGILELMQFELDDLKNNTHKLSDEVLNNLQEMVSVNGIWAITEGPNIGRFTTISGQITKYCPIKRGDIISVKTNGITTRIAFSQEIPSEDVAVYDGPKTFEGVDNFNVISHIDGYFALFYYIGSIGTPEVYVTQNLRKHVQDNFKFPNKEIPYSTYIRADETETIVDVVLTEKHSVFKLIKGETSPCIAFVDFGNNKFGFYTPDKDTEIIYQQEDFGSSFTQGHKYQIALAKIKGYIAKLSVTDLNTGINKELIIDSDSDNLGISYCWGKDSYKVISGNVEVTKLKLVSLQKTKPSLMIIGDSNADHGGLGKNKKFGYTRLIKEAHNGDVSIFSQGGANAFDFVNWIDNYILNICKPTYALISTYNTITSERHILEIEYIIDVLKRHQITPIIATIHPGGNEEVNIRHQEINQWIKNSGYMYFDLAELLSLNNDGITVNSNLLNPDLVHFTKSTNELIATRFEHDFGYIFD